MAKKRKITLEVPEDLLERARASSGEGITQTVRRGLRLRRAILPDTDALTRAPKPAGETYWSKRPARDKTHFRRWF